MPHSKRPGEKKKSLSPSEIREHKKKELGEAENYVKEIDRSNSESGRKFVVDQVIEEEKQEKDIQDDIKTQLEAKKKYHFSYRRDLANYGNWLIEDIKEESWEIEFVPTDGSHIKIYTKSFETKEGIQLIIRDPKGNVYARGMSVSYVPDYDEAGIRTLYVQAENTMDSFKGLLLSDTKTSGKTKGGIYLK